MPYRRFRRARAAVIPALVVAGVIVLVGAIYFVAGHGRHEDASDAGSATPRSTASHRPTHGAHHRHHRRPRNTASAAPGDMAGAPGWFVQIPLGGGALQPGVAVVPGALHHAVLSVSSTTGSPIGLKYAFRLAHGFQQGHTTTARSWSASATVRGQEPLAGLVAQVASGSVTCTASVDGRVITRRSSSGRFATVSCYA